MSGMRGGEASQTRNTAYIANKQSFQKHALGLDQAPSAPKFR